MSKRVAGPPDRARVTQEPFRVDIANAVLCPISFNKNGDASADTVTISTVVNGQQATGKVIVPSNNLVAAA